VIRLAEIFLHSLGVEATGDLLGGCNRELAAGDFNEASAPFRTASAWPSASASAVFARL
jgi:hypothetical protein